VQEHIASCGHALFVGIGGYANTDSGWCNVLTIDLAFGVTQSGSNIVVDTGSTATLVFTVNAENCDITSLKYQGEELQDPSKGTQIASGLGSAAVKFESIGS